MRQFPAERVLAGLRHPDIGYIQKTMKKNHYTPPRLLKTVEVLLERDFLEGSTNKNMTVSTTEQEVVDHDFSYEGIQNGSGFKQDWQ